MYSFNQCVDAVEDSFIKLCFPEEYQAKKDLIESDLLKRSRYMYVTSITVMSDYIMDTLVKHDMLLVDLVADVLLSG